MSLQANKCPKCHTYILGEYCNICHINIQDYLHLNLEKDIPDFLKGMFRGK